MNSSIDRLLHDADRKVMGANMARVMGDRANAALLEDEAVRLYQQALRADMQMVDPAWNEVGNRDNDWLLRNGFTRIAALSMRPEAKR